MNAELKPVTKRKLLLRAVLASKGGKFSVLTEIGLSADDSFGVYKAHADRWQNDYDADGDAVRVYVIDADGVAVYAGGALQQQSRNRQ